MGTYVSYVSLHYIKLNLCIIIQLFHCPNYIYSIFVFNFHMIEDVSLAYLILININLEVSISDVIYIYIYIIIW